MSTRVTRSSTRVSKNENVKENSRPEHPNTNQHHIQSTSKPIEVLPKSSVVVTSSAAKKSDSSTDKTYETIEEIKNGEVIRRYLKGKLLGRGGFAKAYWATCLATQKQYAMKVVLKSTLTKAKAKAKLQAEVKIHSTLKHSYVVRFHHFFEDSECYYMILELCHNRSFSELMKKRKRLTEPEVQYFFLQIIEALIYMHGIGVIHRDLKLGNLLLDKNMNVKIGDLGLAARVSDAGERKRTLCGTPNYIAPEILENKHGHSFQVDIWSSGVVLYTMLVGRPPYESKDIKTTYKKILANDFSFPEHVELSSSARDLICSMLQTKPEKRPSLETIAAHSFFHRKVAPIPASIPVSALLSVPSFDTKEKISTATSNNKESKKESGYKTNAELLKPLTRTLKTRPPPEVLSVEVAASTNQKSSLTARTPVNQENAGRVKGMGTAAMSDVEKVASSVVSEKRAATFSKTSDSHVRNLDLDNRAELSRAKSKEVKMTNSGRLNTNPMLTEELEGEVDFAAEKKKMTSSSTIKRSNSVSGKRVADASPLGANLAGTQGGGDMGTLENIHRNLAETMANLEQPPASSSSKNEVLVSAPTQWVTQYVDYTSKYGLGYLLVDGSTGVYFNDSTKIVLGPEGHHFTYLERVRTDKTSYERTEHHTLSSYPPTLHKKVTLLQHFRDYLLQQQKEKSEKNGDKPQPRAAWTENAECCNGGTESDSSSSSKVFVKKWVRTRHAILFRLSNQNIQVMFLDNTEILLSNEAKVVTFLDKQGVRKTMHSTEVVRSPRNDITKRLKYTKDILRQLISNAKR